MDPVFIAPHEDISVAPSPDVPFSADVGVVIYHTVSILKGAQEKSLIFIFTTSSYDRMGVKTSQFFSYWV